MFQAGQQIGTYKLIEKLGKGGFGEVWLAEKRSEFVTTRVAIKLPHDEQIDFDAIRQEATLWEQASGHPNVLPLIDADVYDGQVAIVSEYAEGGSLAGRLKKQGRFPVRQAVEMTIGILNGLEFLHSKQIVHRDIKPANILLQNDTPRLADFGISRAVETSTVSSVVVGTENYMAPEAFEGVRNIQTDIWSVGVVLYQLLKGSVPFPQKGASETMYAILLKNPEPLPADIPLELQTIVFKALEKDKDLAGDPARRYQSASQMRDDLKSFLEMHSQPVALPAFAPALQNPQTEESTRVKLKIPVRSAAGFRRSLGELVSGRKILPFALVGAALIFAGIVWLAVYLFSQALGTVSDGAPANSNYSNSSGEKRGSLAGEKPVSNSRTPESALSAQEYSEQGYKFYTEKKYDRAIEAYTKGIELSPQNAGLYNDRGLIFYLKRDYDKAIEDFNKALELDPTDSVTYNNRGVAFADKGDKEQAIADYRKALELNPDNERAQRNLKKLLR